jgi:large subunit ribosomal protein L4
MIEIPVFNIEGTQTGTMSVDEAKLGGEVRHALLKQALVYYHANKRQGTVRTKRRGEVEGSTRKLYRQKGTGNARQGTVRQPVRVGGGTAKQRLPKDWRQALPKKARRLARDSAILAKIQDNQLKIVDTLSIDQPKTKIFVGVLKKLQIERTVLLALEGQNQTAEQSIVRAARNIPSTRLTTVAQLNAWDILNTRTLLVSKAGLEALLK